jgi:hypothetical protein
MTNSSSSSTLTLRWGEAQAPTAKPPTKMHGHSKYILQMVENHEITRLI